MPLRYYPLIYHLWEARMRKVQVISFDLDGTLVDKHFTDNIWLHRIPALVAEMRGTSFEEAYGFVVSQYDDVGDKRLEWYDINYWLRRFSLKLSQSEVLNCIHGKVILYPGAVDLLKELRGSYDLVINSVAPREIQEFTLKEAGIADYFKRIFSAVSDFQKVAKDADYYSKACRLLEISPQEMVHVGDNWESDYLAPRSIGIAAFYLDWQRKRKGDHILHSLEDLRGKL
jgi:putative hydrolase of the HAD superfamily